MGYWLLAIPHYFASPKPHSLCASALKLIHERLPQIFRIAFPIAYSL